MAYTKSEETRLKLVKTTSKLLRTQGYTATGVSQILKESGVPKGSLYHHFPQGKTQLAAAAVAYSNEFLTSRLNMMIAASADTVDAFRKFCDFYSDSLIRTQFQKGCPIATITLEAAATVDPIQAECGAGFDMVKDCFIRQLGVDGVSAEIAPAIATTAIAAVEGALILCRAQRSVEPLNTVRDSMTLMLRHVIS